ncbi:MAG: hypothetical protein A3J24_01120 [Deltaproteobacteria bacterium RIFCSPLOWO2_02_FULL_53_8]|nr:MAG: hypothetical protein A3J24_01120 [Deltaproteobacteria bacterium RIFCSPLOWO2_02_FULL_53_8]
MKTIKAELIIFDLDGTLIDSSSDIAYAANRTLERMGYVKFDIEHIKENIGWGVKVLLERLMPQEPPERILEARRSFLEFYGSHLVVDTYLYSGVAETITRFAELGKKMAIVTNKPEGLTLRLLDEMKIGGASMRRYFPVVVGGDTLVVRKPSPEPIQAAIKAAGGAQGSSVMVGDSPIDAEAGHAAGIFTIGVTYGFRGQDELTGFDILLDRFSGLKDVIE